MKTKVLKSNDFIVTCLVPTDMSGFVVNGKFYKTLKQAAIECGVTPSFLSMVLSGKSYSSNFKVHRDIRTIYREEKHKLSYALFNKYEIVNK